MPYVCAFVILEKETKGEESKLAHGTQEGLGGLRGTAMRHADCA